MKIKIFFYIDSFRIGGMHKQILYLTKHLNRLEFDPIVCVQNTDGGLLNEFENTGIRIESLYWKRRLQFSVFKRLVQLLRKEKPDYIFITEPQNFFYYRIARLFYYGKTVQIGSFRAMNFWYGHLGAAYKFVDSILTIGMILTSKKIIVNSEAMLERYNQFLPAISKSKVQVIYNGSDFLFPITISNIELREKMRISINEFIIIMIARLDPWKDFETLLNAANLLKNKIKNFRILIVGDGELRLTIEEKILKMKLENIVYLLGEKKDIYNYINLANVSVLSTKGEGFSNSILESMAFGKAVVASDVGGNAELLGRTKEAGIIIEPLSPDALAENISELFYNPELIEFIGNNAKIKIKKMCDINNFVKEYEKLFKEQFNHQHLKL